MSDGAAWWIVTGVVILAIVALVAVVGALMGHVRPLRRAVRRLRLRTEQAEKLQGKLAGVADRATALEARVAEATTRLEQIKASRQKDRPAP